MPMDFDSDDEGAAPISDELRGIVTETSAEAGFGKHYSGFEAGSRHGGFRDAADIEDSFLRAFTELGVQQPCDLDFVSAEDLATHGVPTVVGERLLKAAKELSG